jgi:hypothetical protein
MADDWSPLTELTTVRVPEDYSTLALTELHYHPSEHILGEDTLRSKDLEFIELKNTGEHAISLSGLVLDSAVYYEFPPDAVLPPGQFFVVASKSSDFYRKYGMVASGNYRKNLSNSGEELILYHNDGRILFQFSYSDDNPWPGLPDGTGHSLVSLRHNPEGSPSEPEYWRSSADKGGSPFADDAYPSADKVPSNQEKFLLYPNPTSDWLFITLSEQESFQPAEFELYDIKGMLIQEVEISGSSSLDLRKWSLTPGVYIARIRTAEQVHTEKIIFH